MAQCLGNLAAWRVRAVKEIRRLEYSIWRRTNGVWRLRGETSLSIADPCAKLLLRTDVRSKTVAAVGVELGDDFWTWALPGLDLDSWRLGLLSPGSGLQTTPYLEIAGNWHCSYCCTLLLTVLSGPGPGSGPADTEAESCRPQDESAANS